MPAARGISDQLAAHAEAVCRAFLPNGRKVGGYWQVGNVDGDPGRSMTVRLCGSGQKKPGRWSDHATGQFGDLLDIIAAHSGSSDFREAMNAGLRFLGQPELQSKHAKPHPVQTLCVQTQPPHKTAKHDDVTDTSEAGARLFAIGEPIAGTLAEAYLKSRHINRFGNALRYHPGVYLRGDDGQTIKMPALLAAITDNVNTVTGCARTWLDPQTGCLASIDAPKRVLGRLHGSGVRFYAGISPYDQIAGEGIESMLSVGTALPNTDIVACLTATHLALYRPPIHIRRLWVAHDNDKAGERALAILKGRAETEHFRVFHLPPIRNDHNDDLKAVGPDIMGARLKEIIRAQVAGAFEPFF
jgi:hypothetical protein